MTTRRIVYTTGQGRLCPDCARPVALCRCSRSKPAARPVKSGDGIVRISRETKGRGGKSVSLINGLPIDDAALSTLAALLKKRCGTGGTVRAGTIEIQGDHRDLLVAELTRLGYRVRKAGG